MVLELEFPRRMEELGYVLGSGGAGDRKVVGVTDGGQPGSGIRKTKGQDPCSHLCRWSGLGAAHDSTRHLSNSPKTLMSAPSYDWDTEAQKG